MIRFTTVLAACACVGAVFAASPGAAESHGATGDAAAGEKAFSKCQACHVVVDAEGNTLAGRKSKTGPNLYGIVGQTAGTVEGYRYGKSLVAAGAAGLVWDQESFAAYVADPKGFLKDYLDDSKARSKMTYKLKGEDNALNIYAFLASVSPAPAEGTEGASTD